MFMILWNKLKWTELKTKMTWNARMSYKGGSQYIQLLVAAPIRWEFVDKTDSLFVTHPPI